MTGGEDVRSLFSTFGLGNDFGLGCDGSLFLELLSNNDFGMRSLFLYFIPQSIIGMRSLFLELLSKNDFGKRIPLDFHPRALKGIHVKLSYSSFSSSYFMSPLF